MDLYEFYPKDNKTGNYRTDTFIHGIADSFDEAIKKFNDLYWETENSADFNMVIVHHTNGKITDIDKNIAGDDFINSVLQHSKKTEYEYKSISGKDYECFLKDNIKLIRTTTYATSGAYAFFYNLNKELLDKYRKFKIGDHIRNTETGKTYTIVYKVSDEELDEYLTAEFMYETLYWFQPNFTIKRWRFGKEINASHDYGIYEII